MKRIKIESGSSWVIREKLIKPFGFKGRYIDELWQAVALVKTASHTAVCPSTQSVLWSDGDVFGEHTPDESNRLMYSVTEHAITLITGKTFTRPDLLIDEILPSLCEYANYICKRKVRTTFVLNALVGVDAALWSLYALENGIGTFDGIIPESTREAMSCRHKRLAHIPLISYSVSEKELRDTLETGTGILKVKIGNRVDATTPETDMRTMLEWDKARIAAIHAVAREYETSLTASGRVCYYLDANGRYDCADRLWSLVDFMDKQGILADTAILEEPFDEANEINVSDFPIMLNADESAHSEADLKKRIALGYRSVALKPIAKTLSMSFRMVEAMNKAGGSYLCADLTVNPLLAEWNKQFAARIAPLPTMNTGCVEVNGNQNYITWQSQKKLLPAGIASIEPENGSYPCDESFYADSGLLFGKNGYFPK